MEVGIDIFLNVFFRNGEQSRQPHAVLDVHQAMLQLVQVCASMTEEGNAGINAAEFFCQKVPGAEMMKHNIYTRHLKQALLPEHLTDTSFNAQNTCSVRKYQCSCRPVLARPIGYQPVQCFIIQIK
jgi:hypothetical protein